MEASSRSRAVKGSTPELLSICRPGEEWMARILVIDDEECIRFTFKTFLEEEGYQVVCAENFDDALAHVSGTEIDLVFADIILEGKTGIEFLRACREKGKSFPVTIVTGYPDVAT